MALLTTTAIAAQEHAPPPVPCVQTACDLVLDQTRGNRVSGWNDRRYGNPQHFEAALRGHLEELGYQFRPASAEGGEQMTLRLSIAMTSAMCDRLPGTDTRNNCRTIGRVRVEILGFDPELDLTREFDVRADCGADELMEILRMSEYTAAMIDYNLRGREGRQPSRRC